MSADEQEQEIEDILQADLTPAEQVKEIIELGFDAEVAEGIVTRYYAEQAK